MKKFVAPFFSAISYNTNHLAKLLKNSLWLSFFLNLRAKKINEPQMLSSRHHLTFQIKICRIVADSVWKEGQFNKKINSSYCVKDQ